MSPRAGCAGCLVVVPWGYGADPRPAEGAARRVPQGRCGRLRGGGLGWLLVLLWGIVVGASAAEPARYEAVQRHMGVPWTIAVYAADAGQAEAAIGAAFAEIHRLEGIFSDYDPESELSRLSAAAPTAQPVPVSEDLWRVLARSVAIRDRTGGAFDPTVGPLTTLWRRARRAGRLPSRERLAAALVAVGPDLLVLDATARMVSLRGSGMRLDLGGIGMGDAVDRALAVLRHHGLEAAMIDASGDVAAFGSPPGRNGWQVLLDPFAQGSGAQERGTITLVDAAVTTSGDARQGVEIDGIRYGHIVDPGTGLGVVGPRAVTVIAPDASLADALATALCVAGPERGLALLREFPGVKARFDWFEGDMPQIQSSPGWPSQSPHIPIKKPSHR